MMITRSIRSIRYIRCEKKENIPFVDRNPIRRRSAAFIRHIRRKKKNKSEA